jgi:chitinase
LSAQQQRLAGRMAKKRPKRGLRAKLVYLVVSLILAVSPGCRHHAAFVPTFTESVSVAGRPFEYTFAGRRPELGGSTTIPTALVPISLAFDAHAGSTGKKSTMSAASDVPKLVQSPIFQSAAFATGYTQYGDAVQRAEFYHEAVSNGWQTLLGQPRITPGLQIDIPAADGYVLTSKRTGGSLAVVDLDFVEKQLFRNLPKVRVRPDELLIALTKNVEFYPLGDATVCCSWGAYGVYTYGSSRARQAFILGTYLDPGIVPGYSDVQAISEQVVEWMNDPLQGYRPNRFPAWLKPPQNSECGGLGEGTFYRFAEPTDGGEIPRSTIAIERGSAYHVENVALLPWFTENPHPDSFEGTYSFPDTHALTSAARPCSSLRRLTGSPAGSPLPRARPANGHELIGYWVAYSHQRTLPLRDVSPQWDVVIVAFAPPVKGSTSRMYFRTPVGYTDELFKSEIAELECHHKKVLISLGGGGEVVTLKTQEDIREFVESVSAIVKQYRFNGVDLDFETPSLMLNAGDTDFRHPTTPAVVNLIAAMRQLRQRFGPKFMIAEVPEGPQVPAGMEVYGGQFGSFLPVIYRTRGILSFVDVQNYNTPPLEGLDGNYYLPETADYYAAMTEMLLQGFPVGGNLHSFFPPLPPQKVAVGFLVGRSPIRAIEDSVRNLIEGKPYEGNEYELRGRGGYRDFNGVMFWNIQADWRENYEMSNSIGPLLHGFPRIPVATDAESRQ